jgi:hypothetical protein
MISSLTRFLLRAVFFVPAILTISCSFTARGNLTDHISGIVILEGFADSTDSWLLTGNRYWNASRDGDSVTVINTSLGSGVSPVWYQEKPPASFEVRIQATLDKEGLDGGWGVEFGAQNRKHAYRALLYGSGRFCVDRVFGLYSEFIHCIPYQPEVNDGESRNILAVKVVGEKIAIAVNGDEVVVFTDDRYEPGELALAVAGAGTGVTFEDMVLLSLD